MADNSENTTENKVNVDDRKVEITVATGTSKKTGKDWKGLKVRIGKVTRYVFPYPSQMDYIEEVLTENNK